MVKRRFSRFIAGRCTDREQSRVDAAARLRGLNRAQYVRSVVLAAAKADIRREAEATLDDESEESE